jgi:hypothetical protein
MASFCSDNAGVGMRDGWSGEAWTADLHGMRASGAPNKSNYALSWIGMANTKFLLDLYPEGINALFSQCAWRYIPQPA